MMKHVVVCALAAFVPAAAFAGPAKTLPQEVNPSVEFDRDHDGRPDGWRFAAARGECFGKWDDEHAASGRRSLRLAIPRDASARAHWVYTPRIPLKPNTGYRLTFKVKTLNVAGEAYAICYENGVQSAAYWHVSERVAGTQDWRQCVVAFRSRADAKWLMLRLKLRYGAGWAWFDDVALVEAPAPKPKEKEVVRTPPPDDGFPLQAMWTPAQWTQHGVLYLVRGHLNPLSVFFRGDPKRLADPALVIETPVGYTARGPLIRGRGPLVADADLVSKPFAQAGETRLRVRLPISVKLLRAGRFGKRFHWENYFHLCLDVAADAPASGEFRWRIENAGARGPWHSLAIRCAAGTPRPLTPPADFKLYVQHTGPLRHPNAAVRARLVEYLKTAGVVGGLAPSFYDPQLLAADRQLEALGMELHTWRFEGFLARPAPADRCVDIDGKTVKNKICPQAQLAHVQPWFNGLRNYYRKRLATGLKRLIIDYEPNTWWSICYCPRCRRAFAKRFGLPEDECLKLSGRELRKRWPEQWARFQAEQNGAIVRMHCRLIHDIKPGAQVGLCSWDGREGAAHTGHDIRLFEPDADFHAPMIYSRGLTFHDRVAPTCARTTRPVLPFVELLDISQPRSLTPAELRQNLLATAFSGGAGAVLWVGMECLDAQYLAAAAQAVRETANLRAFARPGAVEWLRAVPVPEGKGFVTVDGQPVKVVGVGPRLRAHVWGGARRAVAAALNYDALRAQRVRVQADAPCRFEMLLGSGLRVLDARTAEFVVPPGAAAAAGVRRRRP